MRLLLLLTAFLTLSLTSSPASLASAAPPNSGSPRRAVYAPHPTDSIGRLVQGGKTYLKHKVAKGDSFYAIARKYGVPMDQVVAANPKVKNGLSIGQVVLVPRSTTVLAAPSEATAPAEKLAAVTRSPRANPAAGSRPAGGRTHVVASGQTLSFIARKYHVSIGDLRRWNNLKNDNLRLKQRLVVSAATPARPAAPLEAPTAVRDDKPPVAVKDEVAKEDPRKEETRPGETHPEAPHRAPDAADDTTAGTEVAESLRKVTESGMAEAIEASGESTKFLALHRTAAVGSLLQVRNPQNGLSVYVRVIGKLPPTGANENVIIRLSRRAVQKLQVVDARFRVEVSYMP